jgi:hypothetical protein
MRSREEALGHALHCTANCLSLLHARQGGDTGLAAIVQGAPCWPALQEGRRLGNRAQGGLGAWPPGASRAGHCRRAGARGDWGAPVMQGDVQAQGRGCDARGRDDLGPAALVFREKKVG